jgi:23S rRNA pseudouridine1911/1915/1917 synthase
LADSTKSNEVPEAGERLDIYLVRNGQVSSRREARELIAAGRVRVNGHRCGKGHYVSPGDVVQVDGPPALAPLAPDFSLPLEVLYQDEELLVVNKPALLPCHPLRGPSRPTLMNAVVAHFPQAANAGGGPMEGGLIHRLDNGTSGATMVALSAPGRVRLRAALRSGRIIRRYLALVEGALEHPIELDAPIAHHPRNRRKMMAVDPHAAARLKARPAHTAVRPLRRIGGFTLVEVTPRTGNRHQIRVHLADAGFALAGDELYGGPPAPSLAPGRFFLHLASLQIEQRVGSNRAHTPRVAGARPTALAIDAPMPIDLRTCLGDLGDQSGYY